MFDEESKLSIATASNNKLQCQTNLDVVYSVGSTAGNVVADLSVRSVATGAYSAAHYIYKAAVGNTEYDDEVVLSRMDKLQIKW